jgi:hypothetical protein
LRSIGNLPELRRYDAPTVGATARRYEVRNVFSNRFPATGSRARRRVLRLKRAGFVSAAAALAACGFLRNVALGAERGETTAELGPLVETLLPFGSAAFPISDSGPLVRRIYALFDLERDAVFQASLAGFSSLGAFPAGAEPLFAAEREVTPDTDIQVLRAHDAVAFATGRLRKVAAFGDLDAAERARYVGLWAHSAFGVRRRFYSSVRALTFVAFYSTPEAWHAIGYRGPLLAELPA